MHYYTIIGIVIAGLGSIIGLLFIHWGNSIRNSEKSAILSEKLEDQAKRMELQEGTINSLKVNNDGLIKQAESLRENNIALLDKNSTMLETNQGIQETNQKLFGQNVGLSNRIERYQNELEEKERKIQELQEGVENIKDYSNMARLDVWGKEMHFGNGLSGGDTELSKMMKKVLEVRDNRIHVRLDESALQAVNKVIEKYPKFPFGYSSKANMLLLRDMKEWRDSAQKAIEILEITTSIEGHKSHHDEVLKQLRNDLKVKK